MRDTTHRSWERRSSMEYRVYYEGQRFICPVCGGMVYGDEEHKRCLDCKTRFITLGEGEQDREMLFNTEET